MANDIELLGLENLAWLSHEEMGNLDQDTIKTRQFIEGLRQSTGDAKIEDLIRQAVVITRQEVADIYIKGSEREAIIGYLEPFAQNPHDFIEQNPNLAKWLRRFLLELADETNKARVG